MTWKQLSVCVPAASASAAEALLDAAGAEAISLADAADTPVLEPEPGRTPLWPEVVVTGLFPLEAELDALQKVFEAQFGPSSARLVPLEEHAWQDPGLEPPTGRRFGTRLWIGGADDQFPESAEHRVRLHMGHAFGTGRHPTTALCLEWLDGHLGTGARVLDFGCGSGVLALAALRLGASYAWAVDNDPEALAATRRNAELNHCAGSMSVTAPEDLPALEVDIVVANILARPLIERATKFAQTLAPGGCIVLSGILAEQRDAVLASYAPQFAEFDVAERDGWLRVAAQRRT